MSFLLDPYQQLQQARGLLGPMGPPAMYAEPPRSAYISQIEQNAAATSAGMLNVGLGAATALPFVAGGLAPMLLGNKGVRGALGRGAGTLLSGFDPFGVAMSAAPKVLGGKMALGTAALGIGGAYVASQALQGTTDFIREQSLEGQRNFLATRALLRELPQFGFGSQSVLSGGPAPGAFGNQAASQLGANFRSIGAEFGLSSGQVRNVASFMGQSGMLQTSGVEQISRSLREKLSELKAIAKQVGTDIQEAAATYQTLDRMGFRGSAAKASALRQLTTTSGMTGQSISQVLSFSSNTMAMAQAAGLSPQTGADLGHRVLQTTAYMGRRGLGDARFLERYGGDPQAVAHRMAQIHLGTLQSGGAMALLSNAFNAYGGIDPRGMERVMSGKRSFLNYGRLSRMDPYAMADASEDLEGLMGGAILSRVGEIRSTYAKDPLRARREQFRFLSQMGIGDASEQKQYLAYLKAQPRAQFAASLQDLQNQAITSRDGSMNGPEYQASLYRQTLERINQSLSQTFQRSGEALLRNWEETNRKVSTALYGTQRSYGTGFGDMATMERVGLDVRRGAYRMGSFGGMDLQRAFSNEIMSSALSNSSAVRGNDAMAREALLSGPLEKGMYGLASFSSGLKDSLNNIAGRLVDQGGRFGKPTGSMGEMMLRGSGRGPIYMGMTRRGKQAYGSVSDYLTLAARDMGAEYDPASGQILRTDMNAASYLSNSRGAAFEDAFQARLGRRLRGVMADENSFMSGLGGGLSGAGILGGGAFAVGALTLGLPGALVLGGAGLALGGLGGFGFTGGKGALRHLGLSEGILGALPDFEGLTGFLGKYADQSGVARSLELNKEQRSHLLRNRESLLNTKAGDELTSMLFAGDAVNPASRYRDMDGRQRMIFNEMLRRHGGEMGRGLAGPSREGNMSTEMFQSIMYQDLSRKGMERLFGVGSQAVGARREANIARGSQVNLDAAYGGMSQGERDRMNRILGRLSTSSRVSSQEEAMNLASSEAQKGVGRVNDLYRRLREVSGSDDVMDAVSVRSDGQRYMSSDLVSQYLDALARNPDADQEALGALRSDFDNFFASAGQASDLTGLVRARPGKAGTALEREALFGGLGVGGLLSANLLNESRTGLSDAGLARAAGVARGMASIAEVGRGGLTEAGIQQAFGSVGGRSFFSPESRRAALGSLVETSLRQRLGTSGTLNPDEIKAEVGRLQAQGLLTPADAASLRADMGTSFGNLTDQGSAAFLGQLGTMSPELVKELGQSADIAEGGLQASAYAKYTAARNNEVKGMLRQTFRRRSSDFDALVSGLGAMGFTGSALDRLSAAQAEATSQGTNSLQYIKDNAESAGGAITDLERELLGAIGQADGSTPEGKARVKMLSDSLTQLRRFGSLVNSNDDFSSLVSDATRGSISSTGGGGLSLNRGMLTGNLSFVMDPQKAAAVVASPEMRAFERILKGGRGLTAADLELASGATGLTGEERSRQVLGAFGRYKEGMSAKEQSEAEARLLGDVRDTRRDEGLTKSLERGLENLIKGTIGTSEKESATAQNRSAEAQDAQIGLYKLMQGVVEQGAIKTFALDGLVSRDAP